MLVLALCLVIIIIKNELIMATLKTKNIAWTLYRIIGCFGMLVSEVSRNWIEREKF